MIKTKLLSAGAVSLLLIILLSTGNAFGQATTSPSYKSSGQAASVPSSDVQTPNLYWPPEFFSFDPVDSFYICFGSTIYDTIIATSIHSERVITISKLSGPGEFSSTPSHPPAYGYFSFMPAVSGIYDVVYEAKDDLNRTAVATKSYVVFINQPPSILSRDSSFEDCFPRELYEYTISATDPENDPLKFRLLSDYGAIDSLTGLLRFFENESAIRCFTVEVSDSCGADTAEICLSITVNRPPEIYGFHRKFELCGPDTICFDLTAFDPDPGDSVEIVQVEGPGSFFMIDSTTGRTCFYPEAVDSADYIFVYCATDRCLRGETGGTLRTPPCVEDTVIITVVTGPPPQLSCADTSVFICQPETLCFPIQGIPEGANVTVTPSSAWYNAATGSICFYTNCTVNKNLGLIVENECGADTCSFTVSVTMNRPPTVMLGRDTSIYLCETGEVCIPAGIFDPDDNIVSITVNQNGYYNPITGMICFYPANHVNVLMVLATDACGAKGIDFLNVTVNRNEPPKVTVGPDTTVFLCDMGEVCFDASVSGDGDIVSIMVSPFGTYDSISHKVCFEPNGAGIYEFELRATDSCGAIGYDSIKVTVEPNSAPAISVVDSSVFLCRIENICLPTSVGDIDGNLMSVSVSGGAEYADGYICFTPAGTGEYQFIVTAVDSCGLLAVDTGVVNVIINSAPVVTLGDDFTAFRCPPATLICIDLSSYDLDENISEIATNIGFYDAESGQICYQPTVSGEDTIVVTVSDQCFAFDSDTIVVSVVLGELPSISCPSEPISFATCVPDSFCIPIAVTPELAEITVVGGEYKNGELCFYAPTSGRYTMTVLAANECGVDTCLVEAEVEIMPLPNITCYEGIVGRAICAPGEVCLELPITAFDSVTVSKGSWSEGMLCFTADSAGLYEISVVAWNSCGSESCLVSVNVAITGMPAIACPTEPFTFLFCDIDTACFELGIFNSDTVIVEGGEWKNGQICVEITEPGLTTVRVIAGNNCGADTCIVAVSATQIPNPAISCPSEVVDIAQCELSEVCIELPIEYATTVSASAGSWTDGMFCFVPQSAGLNQVQVIAANLCGADTCNLSFNVILAPEVVLTCPDDTTITICDPITICRPVGLNLQDAAITVSPIGTFAEGAVCFNVDTAGSYLIQLIAGTDCSADTCLIRVDINKDSAPSVIAEEVDYFICDSWDTLSYQIKAFDPEGMPLTYELIQGPGAVDANSGMVTFQEDSACILLVAVSDGCSSDTAEIRVTVARNSAPVVTMGADSTVSQCFLNEICIPFDYYDSDGNISSVEIQNGHYVEGRNVICFTPEQPGTYYLIATVTDSCGEKDSDTSVVTVSQGASVTLECPGDTSIFICAPDTICLPVGGIPEGSQVTVTPASAWYDASSGSICFYTNCSVVKDLKIKVQNDCGTDSCLVRADVTMNSNPMVLLGRDTTVQLCQLTHICVPAGVFDLDNNIMQISAGPGSSYNPVTGTICFLPSAPGWHTLMLVATDSCGKSGLDFVRVNVILNDFPQVISSENLDINLCAPEEVCFPVQITDPDNNIANITVSPPGRYNPQTGMVCFTPDSSRMYAFSITAYDSCGLMANDSTWVRVTFGAAASLQCPPDTNIFLCAPGNVCLPVGVVPPNSSVTVSPIGVYENGSICFNADTAGLYEIKVIADSECGADTCSFRVRVELNQGPSVDAGPDTTYFQCNFSQICRTIAATDPNNNIQSITVSAPGSYNAQTGQICFTPAAAGEYFLIVTVTDICGLADKDTVCITVTTGAVANIECPTGPYTRHACSPGNICVPLVFTPSTAVVSVSYGTYSDGQVCFRADTAGTYRITAIATAPCGADTCLLTVNVIFDPEADITCPDSPTSVSLCKKDTVRVLLPITPSNATVTVSPIGYYNSATSRVVFYADTSGTYRLRVIATAPCGADTCLVTAIVNIGSAAQVTCPGDIDTTVCLATTTQICFPFQVTPAGATVTITPSGNYGGGIGCIPINGAGTYPVRAIASTTCGADTCDFNIVVRGNQAPQLTVPENLLLPGCLEDIEEICIDGIFATDPDGDILTITKVCGPGIYQSVRSDSGRVCFTPTSIDTTYEFCFEATDGCNKVTGMFNVTIYLSSTCATCVEISIKTDSCYIVGATVPVKLMVETMEPIGGFDLLVGYDASVMSFLYVTKGTAISGWEYFTYRVGNAGGCTACPPGLVRIVGIADQNDGPNHPPQEQLSPQGLLAIITMRIANDQNLGGYFLPISFYWQDCGDNAFTDPTGTYLYLDARIYNSSGSILWDEGDDTQFPETSRPYGLGAADSCMEGDKITPTRCLDLFNGGICVKHPDSIDARGDVNLNGVAYEIGDAVVLTNFFLYGLKAFTVNVAGQTAASDVNADGMVLTVADLVYLVRVITGDAPPLPKLSPYQASVALNALDKDDRVSISLDSEHPVGAGLLVFRYEGVTPRIPVLATGASLMDMEYLITENEVRVLIYSFDLGVMIKEGKADILELAYDGDGTMTLAEASFSTYYGELLSTKYGNAIVPESFELAQNYPNPFNPSTTIEMTVPIASSWQITIFNVNGQIVKRYAGDCEAGVVTVNWDGRNESGQLVTSGIYLYRAEAAQFSATKKMMLLK